MFRTSTTCSRQTALVTSELFYWHDTLNCMWLDNAQSDFSAGTASRESRNEAPYSEPDVGEGALGPSFSSPAIAGGGRGNPHGASDALPDPYSDFIPNYGGQALSNDQTAAIKRAKDAHFSS